jgi:epoxyqueuosine reductase
MEERVDVARVLPGARSVVSVAMNYCTPFVHEELGGTAKVSRYAWGQDYHSVMGQKLKELSAWLSTQCPGDVCKWYVDTGPVMDKAWAQRAGLGWVGKHTNLITPELGSWVFLGEILTTLELQPDPPATDHCGDCTRCIEACPTDAIVQPYVLDANRCIAYLTIEHRGEIAPELAGHFDGWIFGCDVCQDVCPWNRKFGQPSSEEAFLPREGYLVPDLKSWKELTEVEFDREFADSPIHRARRDGLRRNIELCEKGQRSG